MYLSVIQSHTKLLMSSSVLFPTKLLKGNFNSNIPMIPILFNFCSELDTCGKLYWRIASIRLSCGYFCGCCHCMLLVSIWDFLDFFLGIYTSHFHWEWLFFSALLLPGSFYHGQWNLRETLKIPYLIYSVSLSSEIIYSQGPSSPNTGIFVI